MWRKCNKKRFFKNVSRKKNFGRLKFAEKKLFCTCVVVYTIYQGDDLYKLFELLSELENKYLKSKNEKIEKSKNMDEYPDFEQNCHLEEQ